MRRPCVEPARKEPCLREVSGMRTGNYRTPNHQVSPSHPRQKRKMVLPPVQTQSPLRPSKTQGPPSRERSQTPSRMETHKPSCSIGTRVTTRPTTSLRFRLGNKSLPPSPPAAIKVDGAFKEVGQRSGPGSPSLPAPRQHFEIVAALFRSAAGDAGCSVGECPPDRSGCCRTAERLLSFPPKRVLVCFQPTLL